MHTPTIARELGREFQRICLKLIPTTIREEIRGNPMRKLCLRVGYFCGQPTSACVVTGAAVGGRTLITLLLGDLGQPGECGSG